MNLKDEEISELFFDVYRVSNRYARNKKVNANPLTGQYRCMSILDNMGSMSQKKLATMLDIRSTSLSELVSKLEKKGFVKRETSPKDKRTFLISLTNEGLNEIMEYRKLRIKSNTEIVSPLSDDEKQQFASILSKIKDYYRELGDDKSE